MDPFVVQEVFLSKLLISVKKQQKIELTQEQGWYSESELSELGWSQSDTYHLTLFNHFYDSCQNQFF